MGIGIDLCERGFVPDAAIRWGIRRIVSGGLKERTEMAATREPKLLEELSTGPIALHTDLANDQHYELPAAFFQKCLGDHLKYSCCYYPKGDESLSQAEEAMLAMYLERGQLENGQRILEMGCGWGSLSLYMAKMLPDSEIVSVSNSASQRAFIEGQAQERGLDNLRIITANMLDFDPADFEESKPFDRAISIEMFEHMHNYKELLRRTSQWLSDEGKLFVHIFCHKTYFYKYETHGDKNWMAQHFFTGGTMPSYDLFTKFNEDLTVRKSWWVDGTHYEKTSLHWLAEMDAHEAEIMPVLKETYGKDATIWWNRWRMFYLAVADMFGYDKGREWGVGHYLFSQTKA